MSPDPQTPVDPTTAARRFTEAGEEKSPGLHRELFAFLKANKKFWMIPILLLLVIFGLLLILGATSAAPFIYTLF